jgi:hypothetical protein
MDRVKHPVFTALAHLYAAPPLKDMAGLKIVVFTALHLPLSKYYLHFYDIYPPHGGIIT